MKKLIAQRYTVRRNFIAIICVCLSVYFGWHTLFGERSAFALTTLNARTEKLNTEVSALHSQHAALEDKVVRLRPDLLDPDMLEERARLVLGFNYPSETVILHQ